MFDNRHPIKRKVSITFIDTYDSRDFSFKIVDAFNEMTRIVNEPPPKGVDSFMMESWRDAPSGYVFNASNGVSIVIDYESKGDWPKDPLRDGGDPSWVDEDLPNHV